MSMRSEEALDAKRTQEQIEIDCCENEEIHQELVQIVEQTMPPETELYDLANSISVAMIVMVGNRMRRERK